MKISRTLAALSSIVLSAIPFHAADPGATAADAVNRLGIELLKKGGKSDANAVFSPYSIQCVLAMLYAGADGKTREEMMTTLHFPEKEAALHASFAALQKEVNEVSNDKETTFFSGNRLYARKEYVFRKDFLSVLDKNYSTAPVPADFANASEMATREINEWVSKQTHNHILQLFPAGMLNENTQLVLVNAAYFKASWELPFFETDTQPAPFLINGTEEKPVKTMQNNIFTGYAKKTGYSVVAMNYGEKSDLQFVVLLPDDPKGVSALESALTPQMLADCTKLEGASVHLWMPKFTLDLPPARLSSVLTDMGLKSVFDDKHDANFDRMLLRTKNEHPHVAEMMHQVFLALDEEGTEATAVTGGGAAFGIEEEKKKPLEVNVHVDHPFLFAIQHRGSGACLFIGRVTSPAYEQPQIVFPSKLEFKKNHENPYTTREPDDDAPPAKAGPGE